MTSSAKQWRKRSDYHSHYDKKWFNHYASKRHYIKVNGKPTRSVIMSVPPSQKLITEVIIQNKIKRHHHHLTAASSILTPKPKGTVDADGGINILNYLRSHIGKKETSRYEWVSRSCLIGIQEI